LTIQERNKAKPFSPINHILSNFYFWCAKVTTGSISAPHPCSQKTPFTSLGTIS
jgi:hypothetical protein